MGGHRVKGTAVAAITAAAALFWGAHAHAQFTWTGASGTDELWSTAANWDPGPPAPPPPLDLGSTDLTFGSTGGVAQSPDAEAGDYFNIANILYTGADAELTLIGTGSLSLDSTATILNNSTFLQTINIDLIGNGASLDLSALAADLTVNGTIDLSDTGGVQLSVLGANDTLLTGVISGTGGSLLVNSTGTLTLTGANTYDGGTTLQAGTILLGSNSGLGLGTLSVTGNGTLAATSSATAIANDIDLAAATALTFGGANSFGLGGVISGAGGLVVDTDADDVTLSLTNTNTYSGGTTLTQGTIILGNDAALGTGTLTVDGDGTVQSNDDARVIGNDIGINTGVTLNVTGENNLELGAGGVISGDGSLAIDFTADDDVLTLSGTNTFTGGTTLTQGTVVLADDAALGTGSLTVDGDATVQSDDDARVVGNDVAINTAVTLNITGENNLELGGAISGDGSVTIDTDADDDAVTLSGASTYTGGTTLTQGTLVIGSNTALGDASGALSVLNDATMQSNDDSRAIGNDVDLSDDITLSFTGGNGLQLDGVISGDATVSIDMDADDDTIFLNGVNTYTGGTTLTQGTLLVGSNPALGTALLTVNGDATIQSEADGINIQNVISLADMTTLTFSGNQEMGLFGTIFGLGGLIIDAPGEKLRITASNFYRGGTELRAGTLVIGSNQALGGDPADSTSSPLTVTGNANIEGRPTTPELGFLVFNDIDLGANTLSFIGDDSLRLTGDISGTGGININADADDVILTLSGINTHTGDTTLTRGTLNFGSSAALGDGTLLLLGNGSIRSNGNSITSDNDIDISIFEMSFVGEFDLGLNGVIDGTGSLLVDAADAILTLNGASTYTGTTTIDAGTLLLGETGSITSSVTVNDTGTFGGSGMVTGDLTGKDGSFVTPGLSAGTLTVDGNYVQEMGSTLLVEIDSKDPASSDLLTMTGTATLDAGSTFQASILGDGYIKSNSMIDVVHADGGITDNGVSLSFDTDSVTTSLVLDPNFMPNDQDYFLVFQRAANAYSSAANPGNNTSIGKALDSLINVADGVAPGNAASAGQLLGRLDPLNAADYNTAVNQLSPVTYNTMTSTGLEGVRNFTTQQVAYLAAKRGGYETFGFPTQLPEPAPGSMVLAADDPLLLSLAIAQAEDEAEASRRLADQRRASKQRWGRYIKLDGIFADVDTTTDRRGYNANSFGGQIGVDYSFSDSLIAGIALGYLYTDADLKMGFGTLNDNTIRVGPYMTYGKGDWFLDGSLTFAWHFYDGSRNISFPVPQTADSSYNGYDVTGYLGTGYYFEVYKDLRVIPMGSLLYSHIGTFSFTETGAPGSNLSVAGRDVDSLRSRLGAAISYRVDWKWKPIPYLYAGWEHEYLNDSSIEASFASGGNPFLINTGSPDRDAAFIGVGVNVLVNPNVSAFFRFEQLISNTADISAVAGGLSVSF